MNATNSQVDPGTTFASDTQLHRLDSEKVLSDVLSRPPFAEAAADPPHEEEKREEVKNEGQSSNLQAENNNEDAKKEEMEEDQPSEPPINVLTVEVNPKNPQQNTFEFPNVGLTVSSEFDSGNLARCTQNEENPYLFHLYMAGDSLPYSNVGHYKTWFYFSVKGIKSGDTLVFNVRNMAQQGKLYKAGLKPVFRILPQAKKWR